jgi:hypothetical protein
MKTASLVTLAAALGLAASGAQAALIVTAIPGGPFSPANPIGTIPSVDLLSANTYDFTFDISGVGSALTQVEASIRGPVSEPIQFSLFSGAPGAGTLIATSALMDGPSLTDTLGIGSYFLQIDNIAVNGELLSGGLQVFAVPEPATWGLMLLGLTGLGAVLRHRRRPSLAAA